MFVCKNLFMGEYEVLERKGVNFAGFLLGVDGDENVFGVVVDKKVYNNDPENGKLLESAGYKKFSNDSYIPGMVVYTKPASEIAKNNWFNLRALSCLQRLLL